MASSAPVVNGDLSGDAQSTPVRCLVTPEETIEQMKLLIKENTYLKETLQQTNSSMKEKLEELSVWKERQTGVIEFFERKLEEAKEHISTLTRENVELQRLKKSDGGTQDEARRREVDTLNTVQVEKLQQEKQLQEKLQQALQEKQKQENQLQEKLQQALQQQELQSQRVEELQKSLAQLQEANTQLSDENCRMKEEVKRGESLVQHCVNALQTRLEAAEKALADKQAKIDWIKQEILRIEKELETTRQFRMAGVIYLTDTYTERAAREKEKKHLCDELEALKEQKTSLCVELEALKQQNCCLQDELDALARQSMTVIQCLHWPPQGPGPEGGAAAHSRGPEISKEAVNALQTRLEAAEKALADKQEKMDRMKQEFFRKEMELETTRQFQIEGVMYYRVTYTERAAREEEMKRLRDELEDLKKQNHCLCLELEARRQQNHRVQKELDARARCGEHPRAHLSQM